MPNGTNNEEGARSNVSRRNFFKQIGVAGAAGIGAGIALAFQDSTLPRAEPPGLDGSAQSFAVPIYDLKTDEFVPFSRRASNPANADRLLRMINSLLLMSRLQSGKMELDERPFGLKALADEVMRALTPLAEQSKVRIQPVRGGEAFVRGDRERLSEAIYNLVDHAIHASLPGRSIELLVGTEDQGLATLTVGKRAPLGKR